MNPVRNIQVHPDRAELSAAAAAHVAQAAARAVEERGRFTVALSGGSAMDICFQGLIGQPAGAAVDWTHWHVFWVDERCVPSTASESNSGSAVREFLSKVPIPLHQIHAMDGTLGPGKAARQYEAVLAGEFRSGNGDPPPFDLILLGLGEDGHIASLFPDHPALSETVRGVVPVRDAPKPPPERLTLTLPVINHARRVLLVAAGESKADVVSRVCGKDPRGAVLPAGRVRPANGELLWMLDLPAAHWLESPIGPHPAAKETP